MANKKKNVKGTASAKTPVKTKIPAKVPALIQRNQTMSIKTVIAVLITVVITRLLLTLIPSDRIDMPVHLYYTHYMQDNGILKFYDETKTVYGPVFMYLLFIISKISTVFSISDPVRAYFIKLWSVLADFIGAYLIYLLAKRNGKNKLGSGLAIFYALNPVMIMNSSVWGQFDSIFATLVFTTVYCFTLKKQSIAVAVYTLAVLTKPQSILLLPLVVYLFFLQDLDIMKALTIFKKTFNKEAIISYFANKAYLARIAMGGLNSLFVYSIINLPFYYAPSYVNSTFKWITDFLTWFPRNTFRAVNDYPYATANGFNLWMLLGGQTTADTDHLFFLSYAAWSKILLACLWIFAVLILITMKDKVFSMYCSSAVLAIGFFMFSTRVHEKYMLPAVIFMTACLIWTKRLWVSVITLTGCIFVNIFYTYYSAKKGNYWFARNDGIGCLIALLSLAVFFFMIYFTVTQMKSDIKPIDNKKLQKSKETYNIK